MLKILIKFLKNIWKYLKTYEITLQEIWKFYSGFVAGTKKKNFKNKIKEKKKQLRNS